MSERGAYFSSKSALFSGKRDTRSKLATTCAALDARATLLWPERVEKRKIEGEEQAR